MSGERAHTLTGFRRKVHDFIEPFVKAGTPTVLKAQENPSAIKDQIFQFSSLFGTHSFFLFYLPTLFFCGHAILGRHLVSLCGQGIFFGNVLKDYCCLPRPPSPPVRRLNKHGSKEYGFPSTHSVNAINLPFAISFYVISINPEWEWTSKAIAIGCALLYTFLVSYSRLYLGMHCPTDIMGGLSLGIMIFGCWRLGLSQFIDAWIMNPESEYVVLITIAVGVFFVWAHPDPVDPCPCFEDSVCFAAVIGGVYSACNTWAKGPVAARFPGVDGPYFDLATHGVLNAVARIVVGLLIVVLTRLVMKRLCLSVLPWVYEKFNLPTRAHYHHLESGKSPEDLPIPVTPSLMDLKEGELSNVKTGLRKLTKNKTESSSSSDDEDQDNVSVAGSMSKSASGTAAKLTAEKKEKLVVQYDVDTPTKFIVYWCIGFMAVYTAPVVFDMLKLL